MNNRLELHLVRVAFKPTYTIGRLIVKRGSEAVFACDTMEPHRIDWTKEAKVKGKTAIPEGCYHLMTCMSVKYKQMMPYLMNVPQFVGVMIHPGNVPSHTEGCILVGHNKRKGMLLNSYSTWQALMAILKPALKLGETVKIYVT